MPNVPPSPSNPQYACQCQCNKTPWWKIALEFGAVLVGIAVWVIYYLQLDVMQNTLKAEQRAWIIARAPVPNPELIDGQTIHGTVNVVNTGRTPAKEIAIDTVVQIIKNGNSPTFPTIIDHHTITTGVLWPQDPRDVPADLIQQNGTHQPVLVTPDIHDSLIRGESFIVIYGKVEYMDIFQVHHRTKFCKWYLYKPGAYSAEACTAYNGIEDVK